MRAYPRIFLFALAGALVLGQRATAITTVGHGRLVGTGSVRLDYDSNIFVNRSEVDDLVGTLTGEARYVRDAGIVTFEAAGGLAALAFFDHSALNSVDPYLRSQLGYTPSDKTSALGSLDYRRNSIGNEAVNARTKSNDLMLDGSVEHLPSEKLGFRFTGSYFDSDYLTAGYSEVQNYTLGAHVVHIYSPKLKLLAGLTAVEWWTDAAGTGRRDAGSKDLRYTVGAEGDFASKLTGQASVGMVHRSFNGSGFNDSDALYLMTRVKWAASDKTTWIAQADQNLNFTAADQSVRNLSLTVGLNEKLMEKLTFEGSVGYDRSNYSGFNGLGSRSDHGYVIRGRFDYSFTDLASFDISFGYRDNSSTIAFSDYSRLNIGVGVNVRF